jgi:hypothetical protein
VPFLIWRTWIADRQKHIAQENLYTSLLTKAVDQLGATREEKSEDGKTRTVPNTEVRLGSIYALEKLARDYLPLHWQIMEILCAYVRGNAGPSKPCSDKIRAMYARPWKDRVHETEDLLKQHEDTLREPSVDVQVALTVIGRRSGTQREFEKQVADGVDTRLDLARCHLARVNLIGLHFENALLHESCLEGATLEGTYFNGARLFEAHFENASLLSAHLEEAELWGAHFEGALLPHAHFKRAVLSGTHLDGADLEYANGLTQEQLDSAIGDEKTIIPEGLSRPDNERWRGSQAGTGKSGD